MLKKLRLFLMALTGSLILFSCAKKAGRKETEENLRTAMGLYLNHQPAVDTSRVKFQVVEVSFFEEKDKYLCEFKVNMKEKTPDHVNDTTGVMTADISKDFKTVTRKN